MIPNVNDKELSAVLALPGNKRYDYFVKRVVDWEQIWSLKNSHGWILAADEFEHEVVPVWPHAKFAELCAIDIWAGTTAEKISLSDWLQKWIVGLIRDQRNIAVFPTPSNCGILISPQRLQEDMEAEMQNYE